MVVLRTTPQRRPATAKFAHNSDACVLAAIDIFKHRHEVLIAAPGKTRRHPKRVFPCARGDFQHRAGRGGQKQGQRLTDRFAVSGGCRRMAQMRVARDSGGRVGERVKQFWHDYALEWGMSLFDIGPEPLLATMRLAQGGLIRRMAWRGPVIGDGQIGQLTLRQMARGVAVASGFRALRRVVDHCAADQSGGQRVAVGQPFGSEAEAEGNLLTFLEPEPIAASADRPPRKPCAVQIRPPATCRSVGSLQAKGHRGRACADEFP